MAAPDLEVIKDIPGYKVILKAVIKAQIQQLVEQLAAHTDEESVILTASVADGTLSHLGSDSGKGFLEEQEDVKTQFLGFCLKRHHKKLQAEKEKERQRSLAQAPLPGQYDMGPGPRRSRMPYQTGPRSSFSPQGYHIRSPVNRHEPYHVPRLGRRTSSETSFTDTSQGPLSLSHGQASNPDESMDNIPVKTEPSDDNQISDLVNKDEDNTNSSVSTNDQLEARTSDNPGNLDSESVKVEAISESEFELEITGVEPGRPPVPQDNWGPNVSIGMNFDPSQGASGSPGDMAAQQGYMQGDSTDFTCPFCQKMFSRKNSLDIHMQMHTGENLERYPCPICQKMFTRKFNMEVHMQIHTGEKPFECEICHKRFNRKGNLKSHMVIHVQPGVVE